MKNRYWIWNRGNRCIYSKTVGCLKAPEYFFEVNIDRNWIGRTLKPLFNEKFIGFLGGRELLLIEVNDDYTIGRTTSIKSRKEITSFDGIRDNKVVLLTEDNKIMYYALEENMNLLDEFRIKGIEGRGERGVNITTTNIENSSYVIVSQCYWNSKASSISVYSINKNKIEIKSILDVTKLKDDYYYCFKIYKSIEDKIVFLGLPHNKTKRSIRTFSYNIKKNETTEIVSLRKQISCNLIYHLSKRKDGVFVGGVYADNKILEIKYS